MTKRIVSLLLAALMLISMISVAAAEETPSWLTNTAPATLKVYFDRPVATAQIDAAYGKEPVSIKWTQETGVTVDWEFAIDDSHTKLNMEIAGGEFPDVLVCYTNYTMLDDLAANDVIVKMNELQKTAAPGFVERNMSQNTILAMRERFDTMDIFALPVYSYSVEDLKNPEVSSCSTGAMVLKSVYEAVGSPDITTIDGFLDCLRKVKAMYPDMIPIQASRNSSTDADGNPRAIYKLFGAFDLAGNYYMDQDGTYKKYWYSDNYKKLLEFVNTCYNEGLMDATELTDSGEQLQAKLFSGKVFCNMNNDADNIDWFNSELTKAGVNDEWVFLDQPSIDPNGYKYDSIVGGVGDTCIVIFDTPNKERAMQWVDYVMSDSAQLEIVMGVEGSAWDYNEKNVPTLHDDIIALTDDEKKQDWGVGLYYFLRQGALTNVLKKYSCTPAQTAAIQHMATYYEDQSFIAGSNPNNFQPESKEMKIFTNIKEYYSAQILQLIMCKPEELQAKYEATMTKLADLGQATLDAHYNEYYQNKKDNILKYGSDLDLSYLGL